MNTNTASTAGWTITTRRPAGRVELTAPAAMVGDVLAELARNLRDEPPAYISQPTGDGPRLVRTTLPRPWHAALYELGEASEVAEVDSRAVFELHGIDAFTANEQYVTARDLLLADLTPASTTLTREEALALGLALIEAAHGLSPQAVPVQHPTAPAA